MNLIAILSLAGAGIGIVAGSVQVVDYLERKRNGRRLVSTPPPPPSPFQSALPRGTVTFLITDIEGSSQVWEQSPQAMKAALARHDFLLRASLTRHGGHVFKDTGDGLLAGFERVSDALQAAFSGQKALLAEDWPPDALLRVRMALHTGAAEEKDGDYHGPALNRAARILSAGHGSQILVSSVTEALSREHLPGAITLREMGAVRLRGLSQSETVFQLVHPELPGNFPALRSPENRPNNLPPEITSFVGRARESEEITSLLAKTRLLTLTGAGGSGKTRLSLHVAAELPAEEADEVWLVELASLQDPALVPWAVTSVLNIPEEAGTPLLETLLGFLQDKHLLLILDNCEHLLEACALLSSRIMRSCPHVRILASSRAPLGTAGEIVYRVPSLSLPDLQEPQTAQSLSQYEAVQLFIERAVAVSPAFAITNSNAPAVAQVCHHLDGIPLAIELAAARTRSLPVEEINARLDDRFRLLTGGSRTALPRQQTLRALVDWSYDLLYEWEKTTLLRLSVFSGGWTLTAAETVCADDRIAPNAVLDILTRLVDHSLVIFEADRDGRYRLLETVRQYARDRLRETEQERGAQQRHFDFFLGIAEEAYDRRSRLDCAEWLKRLEADHDNLRAAQDWAAADGDGISAGWEMAGVLWWFWYSCGYVREGRQRLRAVLSRGGAEISLPRAKALLGAGTLAFVQSDYETAEAYLRESARGFEATGDKPHQAWSLMNLGTMALFQNNLPTARFFYEQTLTLYRDLAHPPGIAVVSNNLGILAYNEGNLETAHRLYEESLDLYRQLGDRRGVGQGLGNLGNVAYAQGDYSAARALYEESLAIEREMHSKSDSLAESLEMLARVLLKQGEAARAQELLREGLQVCREVGDKRQSASVLEAWAGGCLARQAQQAACLLGAAAVQREAYHVPRENAGVQEYDALVADAKTALGDAAFQAAWSAGEKLSWEQAIDHALNDPGFADEPKSAKD